jgi:hypothetical protein
MRRVMVVGTSCSGKTELARRLASILGLPHLELDAVHWGPGWKPAPAQRFRAEVLRLSGRDGWVADGNYSRVRDILLDRATHVVWLNYGLPVVLSRAVRRTLRRVFLRQRLFGGNRETFFRSLCSSDSILVWVLRSHPRRRREYGALLGGSQASGLRVVELRRPREAELLLGVLRRKTSGSRRRGA